MAPNSIVYLFGFLPVVLVVYLTLDRYGFDRIRLIALLIASCVYYSFSNPRLLLLLLFSIALNFLIGRKLTREAELSDIGSSGWLWIGVGGNLALLGYFKYANFLLTTLNQVFGTTYLIQAVLLPIGISFFTFMQLAYLVDAYNGQAARYSALEYILFVSFFPYVLSGPIVTHREVIPQFSKKRSAVTLWEDFGVGSALFFIGLFKKVILADGVSDYSTPVFNAVSHGMSLSFFESWFGALAYTAQLYFDFSGYTDMAIGAARLFGITLPTNFNSPFKASSIIEFWSRWHMTLTRFLTNYIYNPIVLQVVRSRSAARKAVIQKGVGTFGAFFAIVAYPTLLTMFISGLWHGAGWTFIAFGFLHGIYLAINHGWRMWRKTRGDATTEVSWVGRALGRFLTFVGVVVSFVFFRADSLSTACRLLKGMFLGHGISLAHSVSSHWPRIAQKLGDYHIVFEGFTYTPLVQTLFWITACYFLVWGCPNSQQWLGYFRPVLGSVKPAFPAECAWRPTISWAIVLGFIVTMALWGVIGIARPVGFLYFKF